VGLTIAPHKLRWFAAPVTTITQGDL
jgi:hypothetical protein